MKSSILFCHDVELRQAEPTVESLETSLVQAAQIIERFGEIYLPVFLLIETALAEVKDKHDVMERVKRAANRGSE